MRCIVILRMAQREHELALLVQAMWATPEMLSTTWNDQGSSADFNVQGWTFSGGPAGFYALGDLVQASSDDGLYGSAATGALLLLKDVSTEGDVALYPAQGMNTVWADALAGKQVSVGAATTSENGTALGCFLLGGSAVCSAMALVHPALLLAGQTGAEIWESGSATRRPLSFWRIVASPAAPSGVPSGGFGITSSNGPGPNPWPQPWTLNPQYLQWQS